MLAILALALAAEPAPGRRRVLFALAAAAALAAPFYLHQAALALVPEAPTLLADRRDLAFVRIEVRDAAGRRIDESAAEISCRVDGGELLGVFSADPKNEDAYTTPVCHAYEGRALAILRAAAPGPVVLTVSSPGLSSAAYRISATA